MKNRTKTFVIGDVHGRRAQLRLLVEMLPRDVATDTLVLLGDLIDRGEDAPGVVEDVLGWQREAAQRVIVLRGNHEQMLLDLIDEGSILWLHPAAGGERTFEQYVGKPPLAVIEQDLEAVRAEIVRTVPPEHIEFFRRMPLYYEDVYALYVHAGLENGKHPRDTDEQHLLWVRNTDFFRHYRGKPCVFGHTPTQFLPLFGRLVHHGIYINHSAIGIDTGYTYSSPLSCLELPSFMLYQAFSDGRTLKHQITTFVSEPLRLMRKTIGARS